MRRLTEGSLACLMLICCAIGNTYAKGDAKTRTQAEEVIVIGSNDPAPVRAEKIRTIELKGKDAGENLSYFEIIDKAKALAREFNANIIKITQHIPRSQGGNGEQIRAVLYRAEDVRAFEKEFTWNKSRRLSWNDFRGEVPGDTRENHAAATFCGIGFETNTISARQPRLKIRVYNSFYTNSSWAKEEYQDDLVLAHEQGHFDLCELYTRKLRERFSKVKVSVHDMKTVLGRIYKEVQDEYVARQEDYEEENSHGVVSGRTAKMANAFWKRSLSLPRTGWSNL